MDQLEQRRLDNFKGEPGMGVVRKIVNSALEKRPRACDEV
jgi:hypothetical protein